MKKGSQSSLGEVKLIYKQTPYLDDNWPVPCGEGEIREIREYYTLEVPANIYREFLPWMGKGSGSFLDEFLCFYDESMSEDPPPHLYFIKLLAKKNVLTPLPENVFVFCERLGTRFEFLDLSQGRYSFAHFYNKSLGSNVGDTFPIATFADRSCRFNGWLMRHIDTIRSVYTYAELRKANSYLIKAMFPRSTLMIIL